jgi:hypothetical protein
MHTSYTIHRFMSFTKTLLQNDQHAWVWLRYLWTPSCNLRKSTWTTGMNLWVCYLDLQFEHTYIHSSCRYDLSATFEMSERVEGSRIRLLIQYNNEIDKDFLALPTNEVCMNIASVFWHNPWILMYVWTYLQLFML